MTNELAFNRLDSALKVAEFLLDNDYVVMLSKEEDLTILNFEYSEFCDRNDVVFMTLEAYEEEIEKMCRDCNHDREKMCQNCEIYNKKEGK